MTGKYFDFDKAIEERDKGHIPLIVKAFGKEYKLPGAVPFDIILKVQRMQAAGQKETGMDDLMEMCNVIFGEQAFTDWRKAGIDVNGIELMIKNVMASYMDNAQVEAEASAESKLSKIQKP